MFNTKFGTKICMYHGYSGTDSSCKHVVCEQRELMKQRKMIARCLSTTGSSIATRNGTADIITTSITTTLLLWFPCCYEGVNQEAT